MPKTLNPKLGSKPKGGLHGLTALRTPQMASEPVCRAAEFHA